MPPLLSLLAAGRFAAGPKELVCSACWLWRRAARPLVGAAADLAGRLKRSLKAPPSDCLSFWRARLCSALS